MNRFRFTRKSAGYILLCEDGFYIQSFHDPGETFAAPGLRIEPCADAFHLVMEVLKRERHLAEHRWVRRSFPFQGLVLVKMEEDIEAVAQHLDELFCGIEPSGVDRAERGSAEVIIGEAF